MKKIKVKIEKGCIHCGQCFGMCPEVFESDGTQAQVKAEFKGKTITDPKLIEKVEMVAKLCPVQVIKVTEVEENTK